MVTKYSSNLLTVHQSYTSLIIIAYRLIRLDNDTYDNLPLSYFVYCDSSFNNIYIYIPLLIVTYF